MVQSQSPNGDDAIFHRRSPRRHVGSGASKKSVYKKKRNQSKWRADNADNYTTTSQFARMISTKLGEVKGAVDQFNLEKKASSRKDTSPTKPSSATLFADDLRRVVGNTSNADDSTSESDTDSHDDKDDDTAEEEEKDDRPEDEEEEEDDVPGLVRRTHVASSNPNVHSLNKDNKHFVIKEVFVPNEIFYESDVPEKVIGKGYAKKNTPKSKAGSIVYGPNIKGRHRLNFNLKNFPGGIDAPQRGSKHSTKDDYQQIVHIILNWEDRVNTLTHVEKRIGYKLLALDYELRKEYKPDSSFEYVPYRGNLRVVANADVFRYIDAAHQIVGHKKLAATTIKIKAKKLFSITEKDVRNYLLTCPVCTAGALKVPVVKGAKKAIISSCFRDQFQCDLVDYRTQPGIGPHGETYLWLVTVKDHFNRLTYLDASPSKEAKEIASILSRLFGFIGYPLTYHSDNGGRYVPRRFCGW